jgi:hypothetical protein
LAAAAIGVSRGSKLTATTSKSRPTVSSSAMSELVTPVSTCVHSIVQV